MTRTWSKADPEALRAFVCEAARLLADRHCEDVLVLDVRGVSQVCDYIILATGTSDRQMRSVAAELGDLGAERGQPAFRSSEDDAATWIVVDFVNVVAHLFEPGQRAYYDLETLWSDAMPVAWERDGSATASKADDHAS